MGAREDLVTKSVALRETEQQLLHELHKASRRLAQEQEDLVKHLFERLRGCRLHPEDSDSPTQAPNGCTLCAQDLGRRASTEDLRRGLSAQDFGRGLSAQDFGRGLSAQDLGRRASTEDLRRGLSAQDFGRRVSTIFARPEDLPMQSSWELRTDSMQKTVSKRFAQSTGIDAHAKEFEPMSAEMELIFSGTPSFKKASVGQLYQWWRSVRREPERTGCLADFVTGFRFEIFTLFMIILNGACLVYLANKHAAIALGKEAGSSSSGPAQSWEWYQEAIFTVFFVVEMILKLAHHRLYFFINDEMWWNIFDLATTVIGVVDMILQTVLSTDDGLNISLVRVIRILRLTRSLRVLRALKIVRSLRTLIHCIIGSVAGLFWCLVLLFFINIICATILVQCSTMYWTESAPLQDQKLPPEAEFSHQELSESFGSVSNAMLSLLKATTGGQDWGEHYSLLEPTGVTCQLLFLTYVMFNLLTVWNLVATMFIERAIELGKPDEAEQIAIRRRRERAAVDELRKLVRSSDVDDSGSISFDEFEQWLSDQGVKDFCRLRGIDIKDAELFYKIISSVYGTEEVEIDVLVSGLMQMRGQATSFDVRAMSLQLMEHRIASETAYEAMSKELKRIGREVQVLQQGSDARAGNVSDSGRVSEWRARSPLEKVQSDIASLTVSSMHHALLNRLLLPREGSDSATSRGACEENPAAAPDGGRALTMAATRE
eukprot:CAMPEP_0204525006 /NCGR_PEP_ID=MMETSP0661-20131031/7675_1 /ASSEMBLY_ACC=CAM_ASM_000606 /TAXON_ID=109239 /ORGANISM="Alexandrium margalefi, Strain AMGDE01CS-322" /LENGTH=714 /DNA_ID=CAMNT_0051530783 /DNA_START=16 /DNA_END=2160 /DNA_ORIENTATION=+